MEKAVRKLMSNTIKLRHWTTLSNCIATHSPLLNSVDPLQDNSMRKESESDKENMGKFIMADPCDDPVNTIRSIKPNYKGMGGKEVLKIMANFDVSLKKGLRTDDMKDSAEFIEMCERIQKDARSLGNGHIIQALQILIHSDVPVNSVVVATLLQLLRISVNNLSVGQILIVHRLLRNRQTTPLVKGLLEALPHVFRNQVPVELDRRNMYTLFKALSFACDINDLQTLSYIMDILSTNRESINVQYVTPTLRALCMLPFLPRSSMAVLLKTKDVIVNNYKSFDSRDIDSILFLIIYKFRSGKIQFYSEDVVNALGRSVIHNDLGFLRGIKTLSKLNRMFHSSIPMLNYITEKFIEDTDILKTCTPFDIYTLIRSFVIADYKSHHWNIMKAMLLNYIINTNYSIHNLITIVYRMISLDCYSPELLERVFTLYYCASDNVKDKGSLWHILKLHQSISYLYPQYNGIRLSQDMMDKLIVTSQHDKFQPLGKHVEEAVGGVKYVKPGLRTKLGDFVEHTIALKPDGSLMTINDFNNNVTFVEDLVLPPDCHKLLVFVFPKIAYSINLQKMQSTWRLLLNLIEMSTGCKTLPINPYLWDRIPKYKKNMFLRLAIQNKFNEISSCTYD